MDAFGDDFGTSEIDPAAEFLAREQDQLAGLEDDLNPTVVAPSQPIEDDFLTSAFDGSSEAQPAADTFAESDFSSANDGFAAMSNGPSVFQAAPVPTASSTNLFREEPEKIRKWREEQKLRLEQKDAQEEQKKNELREQACKELEEWYRHHNETIAKTRAANRESAMSAEKELAKETGDVEPGQEWEHIAKLCDFNPKASRNMKDVSRMRSIILQLKQTPPAAATH